MVIIYSVFTAINVEFTTPEAFLWLKRCVIAGELRPHLMGLVEEAVPSLVHLLGLGRFHLELYTPDPDLPRPVREPQTPSTTVGPSKVVYRPAPPPQQNAWTNGTLLWSDFPALPLPAQFGAAQPPVPATWPLVPVPCRTAPNYATVVGTVDAASTLQAGVSVTLQDVVLLLLEIQAKVRDLSVKVTALERQWDAASPPPQLVPAPVQPVLDRVESRERHDYQVYRGSDRGGVASNVARPDIKMMIRSFRRDRGDEPPTNPRQHPHLQTASPHIAPYGPTGAYHCCIRGERRDGMGMSE
ncbi:hypothetical protein E2C01_017662 [Portunus trituberculatus]|uniref:Uncharacterized protein n=1 Tax=Portunus trituberculatus TaxID=210409 RepID=A0A5B7DUF4_PORTR|nr:hypothetical protein [Portunus trituberculatus]